MKPQVSLSEEIPFSPHCIYPQIYEMTNPCHALLYSGGVLYCHKIGIVYHSLLLLHFGAFWKADRQTRSPFHGESPVIY